MKRLILVLLLLLGIVTPLAQPASAGDGTLFIAPDYLDGYDRTLFKLWSDADKNGCDTRAEVLIAEAKVKPKKGANCKLTGGKWLSSYDGISYTNSSKLDVDHLVPLAEAWRSGAWAWSEEQRTEFANNLSDEQALNAVTASVNRSKGDKDISEWLPKKNVCTYLAGWVTIKARFELTVDVEEAKVINQNYKTCGLGYQTKQSTSIPNAPGANPVFSVSEITVNPTSVSIASGPATVTASISVVSTNPIDQARLPSVDFYQGNDIQGTRRSGYWKLTSGTVTSGIYQFSVTIPATTLIGNWMAVTSGFFDTSGFSSTNGGYLGYFKVVNGSEPVSEVVLKPVTPGSFCSPAGATGKSTSGVSYTCKTSPTDTRNRWRQ